MLQILLPTLVYYLNQMLTIFLSRQHGIWCIGLLLSLICADLVAQCPSGFTRENTDHIYALVRSAKNVEAVHYADSILTALPRKDIKNTCQDFLYFKMHYGEALELLSEWEKSILITQEVNQTALNLENWTLAAESYLALARKNEILDRPKGTLRYLEAARRLIDSYNLDYSFPYFAVRYSSYNRVFKVNRDTALIYATLAAKTAAEQHRIHHEIDGNLLVGLLSEELDTSIHYLSKAIGLYEELGAHYGACVQRLNIARKLLRSDRLVEAKEAVETSRCFEIRTPIQLHRGKALYYNMMKEIAKIEGQLDSAIVYAERELEYELKSNRAVDQERINELEVSQAIAEAEHGSDAIRFQRNVSLIALLLGLGAICSLVYLSKVRRRVSDKIRSKNAEINAKNTELEKSLASQNVLLSEVHHRVKNNLQLVISLLLLQVQKSKNVFAKIALENISEKVNSVALIHDQIYKARDYESIDMQIYFNSLCERFKHLSQGRSDVTFEINAPYELNLDTVFPIGIVTAELIGNSIKYAQPRDGLLKISIELSKVEGEYTFMCKDNGLGYPEGTLVYREDALGSMLLQAMSTQLKGEFTTYNENGAIFKLHFVQKETSPV